ncbi:MAG: YebC/PmpR family DNA-binding transcriptional regulator [candidate division Zixibacteria bacterium]|nr:YebC/PmpR family DNA-binding transcriptional regulator [candidate division Zixibacteria bacterium]
MSGHSKWATIKRKKGKLDAERGKVFTRLIKEVTVAAREGGGDPDGNPRLRTAILGAKGANMPADNIKRAILKGTGQLPGVSYEFINYEGYGPAGVAIYLEAMTDNKNRTVAEVRHTLTKFGGALGTSGCVAWMFEKRGVITIDRDAAEENMVMEVAMENGASDFRADSTMYEIVSEPSDLEAIRSAFESRKIPMSSAEVTMLAQNTVKLTSESDANSMLKLMDMLEDSDDVQKVYSNFDIDEAIMQKLA